MSNQTSGNDNELEQYINELDEINMLGESTSSMARIERMERRNFERPGAQRWACFDAGNVPIVCHVCLCNFWIKTSDGFACDHINSEFLYGLIWAVDIDNKRVWEMSLVTSEG